MLPHRMHPICHNDSGQSAIGHQLIRSCCVALFPGIMHVLMQMLQCASSFGGTIARRAPRWHMPLVVRSQGRNILHTITQHCIGVRSGCEFVDRVVWAFLRLQPSGSQLGSGRGVNDKGIGLCSSALPPLCHTPACGTV